MTFNWAKKKASLNLAPKPKGHVSWFHLNASALKGLSKLIIQISCKKLNSRKLQRSLGVRVGGVVIVTHDTWFQLLGKKQVQVTLEQHKFELCGSTYTQIFFNKYYRTTSWIHEAGPGANPLQIPRNNCRSLGKNKLL